MEAAGPGSWPGGGGDAMNASGLGSQATLLGTGLAPPLVIPSKNSGQDAASG